MFPFSLINKEINMSLFSGLKPFSVVTVFCPAKLSRNYQELVHQVFQDATSLALPELPSNAQDVFEKCEIPFGPIQVVMKTELLAFWRLSHKPVVLFFYWWPVTGDLSFPTKSGKQSEFPLSTEFCQDHEVHGGSDWDLVEVYAFCQAIKCKCHVALWWNEPTVGNRWTVGQRRLPCPGGQRGLGLPCGRRILDGRPPCTGGVHLYAWLSWGQVGKIRYSQWGWKMSVLEGFEIQSSKSQIY